MNRRATAERFLTTVLFTDIVGSTEHAAELGDQGWRELVQLHHAIVRAALRRHGGREIDTAGDSFFAVFDAPAAAVACALDIVAGVHDLGIEVRAGLHVGEVEQIGRKVGGITVPIASRISASAGAGEVLVSATIRDLAAGAGLRFEDRGARELKGVPGEWLLFAVTRAEDVPPAGGAATAQERATQRAAAVRRSQGRPYWRRHPRMAAAIVISLALVVGTVGLFAWSPWRTPALPGVSENTVGIIEPGRNEIVGQIPVGAQPGGIAFGEGAVWVANSGADAIARIDPRTQAVVDTIDVGKAPTGVAVGNGSVWVANGGERSVSRINVSTGRVVDTITVGNGPSAIAFGADAVWVANRGDGTVMRIDPSTDTPGPAIGVGATPSAIVIDDLGAWVASEDGGVVVHLDPGSGVTLATPIAVGSRPTALAIGAGAVWVASAGDGSVSRIDPAANRITAIVEVGGAPTAIASAGDAIWVAGLDGAVERIDPANPSKVLARISTGSAPQAIALVDDRVWFTTRASAASHRGGTLRVVSSDPPPIDPAVFGNAGLLGLMSDGLVGYRRTGGIAGSILVPDLATSLPRPTDAGLTYTFQLRQGLAYSDGRPVRPEDFRTAIERAFQVADPNYGNLGGPYYAAIQGAAACKEAPVPRCDLSAGIVSDAATNTITFHLSAPDPDFLYKLAFTYAFPVPATAGLATTLATQTFPSVGPYVVTSVGTTEVRLARNPKFHSWDPIARPDGYVDEILWTFGMNAADQVQLVERGEADYMADRIPPEDFAQLGKEYTPQVHVVGIATTYAFMNAALPPFDRLEARQAVNMAIDRAHILEMRGGSSVATITCQVLPPNFPGYQPYCPYTLSPDPGGHWTAPDVAAAQRLVDASGTRRAKVVVGPFVPRLTDVGAYFVSVLRELGYDATQQVATKGSEVFQAVFVDKRVQIGAFEFTPDYVAPNGMLGQFTCESVDNITNYCDPALDAMVNEARDLQTTDAAAASQRWAAIDRKVTDQALWAPMLNEGSSFVSARVGNYQFHPNWGILLDQVWVQ